MRVANPIIRKADCKIRRRFAFRRRKPQDLRNRIGEPDSGSVTAAPTLLDKVASLEEWNVQEVVPLRRQYEMLLQ